MAFSQLTRSCGKRSAKRRVCLRGELRSGLAVSVPAGVLMGTLPATSAMQAKQPAAPADQARRETAHARNKKARRPVKTELVHSGGYHYDLCRLQIRSQRHRV